MKNERPFKPGQSPKPARSSKPGTGPSKPKNAKTSWEPVQKWYRNIVGDEGHYYHKSIILPGLLRLMELNANSSLLDLGCGTGILGRHVMPELEYHGFDIAPSFIKEAKHQDKHPAHCYDVADVTKPFNLKDKQFSHAAIVLALQNMENPVGAFKNASKHLKNNGKLFIVMNHPCFRIPRQSSWGIDEQKKIQYRRIDRYYTPMPIPIQAHPSKGDSSAATISFHYPISHYIKWLKEAGFVVSDMEEWCSDKSSTGAAAKMENRSRDEFPLFLAVVATKVTRDQ